ncbi:nodulation protein NfeD [Mechercharimyces sp. CAU 1602]|uniref:NfeD family protein n=1 Tax=Mechercharimyces sp. CAU 1602 TaxID=2973933 RepID=UPI0021615D84|nr:nodulation protein NfeD [Mechercharimyces sp. CAU 1602]MCS1350465.1 nodulation protein NfeD [Mechercharimyces sp. CAU 1602]
MRRVRLLFYVGMMMLSLILPLFQSGAEAKTSQASVYVIPVEETIEQGLSQFLTRAFSEAAEADAEAIVLEMDTLGGSVDAALEIGKTIRNSDIPVTVYIKGEAISAGAYIALNTDKIMMQPGSAIGAAEPKTITGEPADAKTTSFWSSNMRAAAEQGGRNPDIARGMVERDIEIEGVKKKGEILSLSAKQAVDLGMADRIVESQDEVIRALGLGSADVISVTLSPSEQLARWVTSPFVFPLLFLIGIAGLAMELFSPGFGLPGSIGLSAFALYFFGHYIAGFAGWESVALFVVGLALMVIELFVPGFAVFGILGIVALIGSIALAAYDVTYGLAVFLLSLVVVLIGMVIAVKFFGKRGVWKGFVLKDEQKNEAGYISNQGKNELLGKRGTTMTQLRPSGWAMIEGERFDVMSEGGFIPNGVKIKVVHVSGASVFVRQLQEEDEIVEKG